MGHLAEAVAASAREETWCNLCRSLGPAWAPSGMSLVVGKLVDFGPGSCSDWTIPKCLGTRSAGSFECGNSSFAVWQIQMAAGSSAASVLVPSRTVLVVVAPELRTVGMGRRLRANPHADLGMLQTTQQTLGLAYSVHYRAIAM